MTLLEFRTKAYEVLTKKGFEEINGQMYYPESSVIAMLEWMFENSILLSQTDGDLATRISESISAAFAKINNGG
jgi:hypothetical protein